MLLSLTLVKAAWIPNNPFSEVPASQTLSCDQNMSCLRNCHCLDSFSHQEQCQQRCIAVTDHMRTHSSPTHILPFFWCRSKDCLIEETLRIALYVFLPFIGFYNACRIQAKIVAFTRTTYAYEVRYTYNTSERRIQGSQNISKSCSIATTAKLTSFLSSVSTHT